MLIATLLHEKKTGLDLDFGFIKKPLRRFSVKAEAALNFASREGKPLTPGMTHSLSVSWSLAEK